MKIVGYVRVSGAEERLGTFRSLEEQETILRAWARERNHLLVAIYKDTGLAQGDKSTRAGLISLLDSMEEGWQTVVVVSLDRLATREFGIDVLQELRENEKAWHELGDAESVRALEAARVRRLPPVPVKLPKAEKPRLPALSPADEKQRLAARLFQGRVDGARRGMHQSGPAPFGYRREYGPRSEDGVRLTIDPEEGEIVSFMFKQYLRCRSMKRLIEMLEERKWRTRRDKRWSRAGVSWILKNDTYVGRVHFGDIRTRGQHDPLVPPILYNKVQKLIRENDKRKRREAPIETLTAPAVAVAAGPTPAPAPSPALVARVAEAAFP